MKKVNRLFLLTAAAAAVFAAVPQADAFIPSSRTILGRLARNNGKGVYVIDQEVQFRSGEEPVTLRERWYIENGESLRMIVTGARGSQESWRLDTVYNEGKRYFIDSQGQVKASSQSGEFIEPFLYFRSAKSFMDAMVKAKIVPGSIYKDPRHVASLKDLKYAPEPYLRLSRTGGAITYAFGEATPANAAKLNPGFWVDQDAFLFRRLRFTSQAEVLADKHSTFASGVKLPRERTVNFNNESVSIRVLSVKSVSEKDAATLLAPSSLAQTAKGAQRLPDLPQVKEFYSRFR